jgi:hypothetical protein
VGEDIDEKVNRALDKCRVAFVLVGPNWLNAKGSDGGRRIDDPDDPVRREVAIALDRSDVGVVPVRVEGAQLPKRAELPEDLRPLTRVKAPTLADSAWDSDVATLGHIARQYDRWWWRALRRTPRAVLIGFPTFVAIAVAIAAVATGPGKSRPPDRSQRIASCERTHGLPTAESTRPTRSGETQINRAELPPPLDSPLQFTQTTYASCGWPPPPGADSDGYRAIAVTLTNGPGQSDGSGSDFVDVIESQCKRLRLQYVMSHMVNETRWRPFVARQGDIWGWAPFVSNAQPSFTRIATIGSSAQQQTGLAFYPPLTAIVVMHGQQTLERPTCLA